MAEAIHHRPCQTMHKLLRVVHTNEDRMDVTRMMNAAHQQPTRCTGAHCGPVSKQPSGVAKPHEQLGVGSGMSLAGLSCCERMAVPRIFAGNPFLARSTVHMLILPRHKKDCHCDQAWRVMRSHAVSLMCAKVYCWTMTRTTWAHLRSQNARRFALSSHA